MAADTKVENGMLLVSGIIPTKDMLRLRKAWTGNAHAFEVTPQNLDAIVDCLKAAKVPLTNVSDWLKSLKRHWRLSWDTTPDTYTAPQGWIVCEYPSGNFADYEEENKFYALRRAIRSITNREYTAASSDGHQAWRWPLNDVNARQSLELVEAYALDVAPDLQALLVAKAMEWEAKEKGSYAMTDDGSLVIPGILQQAAYTFQRAGVATMLANKKVILADDTGLGKTVQSVGVLACAGASALPVLISCGAKVRRQWYAEMRKWHPDGKELRIFLVETTDQDFNRAFAALADVVIVSHTLLSQNLLMVEDLRARGLKTVILDECHHFVNGTTKQTRAALEATRDVPYRLLLSATPFPNRVVELTRLIDILDDGSGDAWSKVGGRAWFNQTFGRNDDQREISRYDFETLNKLLRQSGLFIRRTKQQVADMLPEVQDNERDIEISNRESYDKAEQEFLEWAMIHASSDDQFQQQVRKLSPQQQAKMWQLRLNGEANRSRNLLAELAKLRHALAMAKVPAAIEVAQESDEVPGAQTVVFAHHREALRLIGESLEAPVIAGGDNEQYAEEVRRAYRAGEIKTVIVSQEAGGESSNMQPETAIPLQRVVMCEHAWAPRVKRQCIGRVHRIGLKAEGVQVVTLNAPGTVDDHIKGVLAKKYPAFENIMDAGNEMSPVKQEDVALEVTKSLIDAKAATFKWSGKVHFIG